MAVEHELRLPGRGREAAELGGELALVARRLAVEDRCGGKACGDERLVDPVARERVDEPGGVADEEDGAARGIRRAADRQPPTVQVGQLRVVDAVLGAEPTQVRAQPRAFRRPAADAVVRVPCLREDPAVAARDDPELDRGAPGLAVGQRPVPLERDPVEDAAAEARVARDPPVDAVGADEHAAVHGRRRRPGSLLRPVRPLDLRP